MMATILLFIGECYRYVMAHKRAFYVISSVALILAVAIFFHSCFTRYEINKTQDAVTNSRIEEANKDATAKTANTEIEQKKKTAQTASNEREQANKRDSKEYANDNAGQRFCERFPLDSSCGGANR